jgi:Type I phosphodiesterase / nucleotide pyrophosphatase
MGDGVIQDRRMRRPRGTVVAAIVGALALLVSTGHADAAPKPPLVYVVVIDGLDGDSVESGQAPFISSLLAGEGGRGSYFPRSSSVLPAETNPNHTAMMTGAFPGSSGIAANAFALYAPLANADTCFATGPVDLSERPTQTSGESPGCPRAETVFEAVRRQAGRQRPTTAVVMGKPKLGRIFDVRFKGRRAADHLWAPCTDDTAQDDSYCADVPTNPITGYAQDDAVVMDEVIRTAVQGIRARGRTRRPSFTFVNLPQVDTAGHTLGRGLVYDASVGLADDQVERLVGTLRERNEWKRTAMILVSDHSMDTTLLKTSMTSALTDAGVPDADFLAVQNGSVDFVYLADRAAPRARRNALLKRMRDVALATPGVADALYRRPNPRDGGRRHVASAGGRPWRTGGRTGDLIVTSDPGWAFAEPTLLDNPLIGNHGAPQTADNFMAVVGGWQRIRTRTVTTGARARPTNADVAATVMRLLGLRAPRQNEGRPLGAAFQPGTLRRR